MTEDPTSIVELLIAISRLPEGRRRTQRGIWYESQKEHWVGWLFHYCVFRTIVTDRSGIVTAEIGIVTGRSGNVTERTESWVTGCV
jgi:hypothetical protein